MRLSLGFSTCPNDTFIFDALVNGKVGNGDLVAEPVLADVEELNKMAFREELDITKISYHAYAYISSNYLLFNTGSALGRNNGPLLVSKRKVYPDEIQDARIAIPGRFTTANMLLSIAYPGAGERKEYLFSDIEEVVLSDEADAGLLIHETRFTYMDRGLKLVADLGKWWDELTGMPIPLGGIAVHRRVPYHIAKSVENLLLKSIEYSYANPDSPAEYMSRYAATMDEDVMRKHISLYVNKFTMGLGTEGREAVKCLYSEAYKRNVISKVRDDIFLD